MTNSCQTMHTLVEKHFSPFLSNHGFFFVTCESDGSPNRWEKIYCTYESSTHRILFSTYDGSFDIFLATNGTKFPSPKDTTTDYLDTNHDWHHIITLIEKKLGKKVLTDAIIHQMHEGNINQITWTAEQLTNYERNLFEMVK